MHATLEAQAVPDPKSPDIDGVGEAATPGERRRLGNPPIPDRRRQHYAARRRLSRKDIETARRGIAQARASLAQARAHTN